MFKKQEGGSALIEVILNFCRNKHNIENEDRSTQIAVLLFITS